MNHADFAAWLAKYGAATRLGRSNNLPRRSTTVGEHMRTLEGATHAEGAAALVGDNVNQALEADDDAVQNLPMDGSPGSSPAFIEAFANAPATGAATLLDIARAASGWDPLRPEDPANVTRFGDYLDLVLQNPMFHMTMSDAQKIDRRSQSWSKVIDEIANLFDGVAEEDMDKIKTSLVGLAEAATSYKDTEQTRNLFAQNTIQTDDGELTTYIFSSKITFVEHDGKSTSQQQTVELLRTRLSFQLPAWNVVTASEVAQHHFKSLSDWLDRFTTKQGNRVKDLSCFRDVPRVTQLRRKGHE